MSTKPRVFLIASGALVLGATASWLKLRFHCRVPVSEACVWGKAYFPITLPVETIAFGLVLFGLTLGLRHLLLSRRGH